MKFGAKVTVFEALHVIGGVLRYGIPSFRLPRDIIEREVNQLREAGVEFITNKVIGKTFTIAQLTGEMGFDAVFVAAGAGAPTFLGIPGEFAGQVYSANEFLTRVNLMGGDRFPYQGTPIGAGDSVIVIGAGNTAMDCLRVAKRLGAAEVRCVYRRAEAQAPARVEELRHAREEGVVFSFLHGPVEMLLNDDGDVNALRAQKMVLGDPDARGRRAPIPLDEFVQWPCDTVIYALGTRANPIVGQSTQGSGAEPARLHRRRRRDTGDQPARRVCRRRHRHRRCDRDPGDGCRSARGTRDRRLAAAGQGSLADHPGRRRRSSSRRPTQCR